MKRALMPILLIVATLGLLMLFTHWYEQHWGLEGPFPSEHHH